VPTEAATPTPQATPDPNRAAQLQYCDTAAPPGHIALPPLSPTIHITPPDVPTQPTPTTGGPQQVGADPTPHVTAPHVAVLDEDSGALLFSMDPFAREAPASITKIVTTIVALEREPDLSSASRISARSSRRPSVRRRWRRATARRSWASSQTTTSRWRRCCTA
jgi:hypothetical protein